MITRKVTSSRNSPFGKKLERNPKIDPDTNPTFSFGTALVVLHTNSTSERGMSPSSHVFLWDGRRVELKRYTNRSEQEVSKEKHEKCNASNGGYRDPDLAWLGCEPHVSGGV